MVEKYKDEREEREPKAVSQRSKTAEELIKSNMEELEKLRKEFEKKGKSISKAGMEELLILLWLLYEDETDVQLLGKLKGLLDKLLNFPSLLSKFKLAPSSPKVLEGLKGKR